MSAGARPTAGRESPIERATLVKIARDTASRRMAARPSLLSAYLNGSVAAGITFHVGEERGERAVVSQALHRDPLAESRFTVFISELRSLERLPHLRDKFVLEELHVMMGSTDFL